MEVYLSRIARLEAVRLVAYKFEMLPSAWTNVPTETRSERELLEALQWSAGNAMVVTRTVRAARALRQRYNRLQHAEGHSGWMSPSILAWEAWMGALWDAAILGGKEDRMLLNEVQDLEIWRRVLARDEDAGNTLSAATLAELAQRCWREMQQYRISPERLGDDASLDAKAFSRWAAMFEELCRRSSFLSPALLEAALARAISAGEAPVPREIFLLGFDRVTPAQALLIDTLRARGCEAHAIELRPEEITARSCTIVRAPTEDDEIAAAAHWIRGELLANPNRRIGVMVPDMAAMRGAIDATFRNVLAPSSMDIREGQTALPYEFSLGTHMRLLQPIRTAFTLLHWLEEAIPVEDVSWLTVQGGFGPALSGSQDARARLDSRFRDRELQLGGPVPLAAFRQWLSRRGSEREAAELRRALERLSGFAAREKIDKPRSFGDWREFIEEALAAAEWHLPGARESADRQLLRRWNTLLDELSSLNSVAGPVRFSAVVERLDDLAARMVFTLETRNAPVQILGIAESAGMVFDAIWWLNARAGAWPPRGKAQPFLPWSAQRAAHMPNADPEEDSAFARRVTRRVLDSANAVVVSFALEERDTANSSAHVADPEMMLSPLVREVLPDTPIAAVKDFLPEALRVEAAPGGALEQVAQEPAVPFQGSRVRGGVRFLELHAACPFRAFAELRLMAGPLPEPESGLSASAQGKIAHRVLEKFWTETKSQKGLLTSTPEEHRELLRRHIQSALADFFHAAGESWQRTLLEVEAERLEGRLLEWLEREKQRSDFTVLKTEAVLEHLRLGGVEMRCRIDRIDRVEQGVVLIDYKTGRVDRNSCEGERPDQPQLPAYAILRDQAPDADEGALAGVAFAGLHPRDVGFTVIGSLASVFSKSQPAEEEGSSSESRRKPRWNPDALSAAEMRAIEELWSSSLTRLAEEFRAGAAAVDPKKHGETCRHCGQTLLCRIRESAGSANMAESGQESFEL